MNSEQQFDGRLITRQEAKLKNLKYYFTRKECKRGHVAFRNTHNSTCLHCVAAYHVETYDKDKSRQKTKQAVEWAKNNIERSREIKRNWVKNNPVKQDKSNRKRNDKRNETRRLQRLNGDASFIVRECMSDMIKRICKLTGKKKKLKTCELLGYTVVELKDHLESLFTDGMTWENRGDWHVDHIVPVSWWLENGVTDPSQINALINLQPLWAKDNLTKSDKLI